MIDGCEWWVAADIARLLGFRDAANMVRRLDDDEGGTHLVSTPSGYQEMTIISESGLFTAIIRSRRPEAKPFRRWVTGHVLPSIRRYGMYPPPDFSRMPANDWSDGVEKPLSVRFREERSAWEERTGYLLADLPDWSKPIVTAVETGAGGLFKRRRVEMLVRAGLDVSYILTGKRTLSPQERRTVDHLRHNADPRAIALMTLAQRD